MGPRGTWRVARGGPWAGKWSDLGMMGDVREARFEAASSVSEWGLLAAGGGGACLPCHVREGNFLTYPITYKRVFRRRVWVT